MVQNYWKGFNVHRLILFVLITVVGISGQITVHVLHPWASDTARVKTPVYIYEYESWYPGIKMIAECNNWYTWTIAGASRTSNDRFEFGSYIPAQNDQWRDRVTYGQQFVYSTIFVDQPAGVNEVWIVTDGTKPAELLFKPPTAPKVLHVLNPWELGVPRIQIKSKNGMNQYAKADSGKCGWYRYDYFGCLDDIQIRFANSIDSSVCGNNGKGDSTYIDLTAAFAGKDTVWLVPSSGAGQTTAILQAFPGTLKDCSGIDLAVDMHDIGTIHPDYDVWVALGDCAGLQRGMVEKKLGSDGLPVIQKTTCPLATQFDWFATKTLSGSYTNETCCNLQLKRNEEGYYYYDDSSFYPIDDFKYLDPAKTILNPNNNMNDTSTTAWKEHNNHFTMIISASFEYTKGQTFYFRGDDDVWVFIDSQLVVDLGGVHPPSDGAVNLDTLGLTPGKTYDFKLFYTERNCCGSNFRMVTSLNLRTNSSFFVTPTQTSKGVWKYEMFEKITKHNLSCSFSTDSVIRTDPAVVDFSITGPSFTQKTPLAAGTSYGGITIDAGNISVQVDTAKIDSLDPGDYIIFYALRSDQTKVGTISFTVNAPPPHHYDLLNESITLDKKKDAQLDSVVLGLTDSTTRIYAVLRDSTGAYIRRSNSQNWSVRDIKVVKIEQSLTDPSVCTITKVGDGVTWIIVRDPLGKLLPDSVMVISYIPHQYPVVRSALMLDNDANLIPDMLYITLSDTFQTDQTLDSVVVEYNGQSYLFPVSDVTVKGVHISVPFVTGVQIDTRPSGTVTLVMTVKGDTKRDTHSFSDGVSPAIIAADVLENDGSQADVLFLTFSEPMNEPSIAGKQLLHIKSSAADTAVLSITRVVNKTNDSTFAVQIAATDRKISVSDRLRLQPESTGGTISDSQKNKPHDLNKSVVIGLRAGAAVISSAWYLDANADGYVDQVIVRFKRKVQSSELDSISVQWKTRAYSAKSQKGTVIDDSTYSFALQSVSDFSTQGSMLVTVAYSAMLNVQRAFAAIDSAAPVLVSSELVPKTSAGTNAKFALSVKFSESVSTIGTQPFLCSTQNGTVRYAFSLSQPSIQNEVVRFTVDSIVSANTVSFAKDGDSIWIDIASDVTDLNGKAQKNPLNHRVLLSVSWPDPDWELVVKPNPFVPSETPIPSGYSGSVTTGTAIVLQSKMPFDIDDVSASIMIIDGLGTIVTKGELKPVNSQLYFLWDGTNRQGRQVGRGTYLAVLKIQNKNRPEYTIQTKIGVTRK